MSDHFDGRQFFNPTGQAPQPFAAVPRMLREPRAPWPRSIPVLPQSPPPRDGAAAVVTFIGHSTFLVQTPAVTFLTDPMFSERAGPLNAFGPRRVREPAVRFADLPRIDVVLLSHNHYDHCDLRTLRRLARTFAPEVVTPLGNGRLVRRAGISRVHELDWWDEVRLFDASIRATPAHHFSARTPFDRNRALWSGFSVEAGGVRIYFAGDTAYAPIFGDIRARCGPIDLALLPIGAYEPRWFMHAVHMNPDEAVQAHCDLAPGRSLGMHFGTFQLTTEPIDAPLQALDAARRARGVPVSAFRAPEFGESVRVDPRP